MSVPSEAGVFTLVRAMAWTSSILIFALLIQFVISASGGEIGVIDYFFVVTGYGFLGSLIFFLVSLFNSSKLRRRRIQLIASALAIWAGLGLLIGMAQVATTINQATSSSVTPSAPAIEMEMMPPNNVSAWTTIDSETCQQEMKSGFDASSNFPEYPRTWESLSAWLQPQVDVVGSLQGTATFPELNDELENEFTGLRIAQGAIEEGDMDTFVAAMEEVTRPAQDKIFDMCLPIIAELGGK